MPKNRWGGHDFDFEAEWSIGLYVHGDTVYDEKDRSNPGIQALLPTILELTDHSPELVIRYRCKGSTEARTWDSPGGTYFDVWATGAYLYATYTELTPLDDNPPTIDDDPEYEGLHLQNQYTAPGQPRKIPLNKQQTDDISGYYQDDLDRDAMEGDHSSNYDETIERLARPLTEDPDILI